MSAPARLTTARMIAERLARDHIDELTVLLCDPRVARWLAPDGLPPSAADVSGNLSRKLAHWREHGFGYWLLRDRETGEMIGRGGLERTRVGGADEVEVGWAIRPERWSQGYATELAQAAIGTAFNDLQLTEVIAYTLPDNLASRRVMEKTGFRYDRDIQHAGLPHVLYRRTR